jgi:hypothetical protein
VNRIDPEQQAAPAAVEPPATNFIPLSSLKR